MIFVRIVYKNRLRMLALVILLGVFPLLVGSPSKAKAKHHVKQSATYWESSRDLFFVESRPVLSKEKLLPQLNRLANKMDQGKGRSVLLITANGNPFYSKQHGKTSVNTRFPIASCSKALVSAVILSLVDSGILTLDQPISGLMPQVKGLSDAVTLRQLLSHTSGLRTNKIGRKRNERKKNEYRFPRQSFGHKPGTHFCYSNWGYDLAKQVAVHVSGMPWDRLFQLRIAQPLSMTGTKFTKKNTWSTASDYRKFLQMVSDGGYASNGHRVLSGNAIRELTRNQIGTLKLGCSKRANNPLRKMDRYSLGLWMMSDPHHAENLGHHGTSGFRAHLDLKNNIIVVAASPGNRATRVKSRKYFEKIVSAVSQK